MTRRMLQMFVVLVLVATAGSNHRVLAQTPTPVAERFASDSAPMGYTGNEDLVFRTLNEFWTAEFENRSQRYTSPGVIQVTTIITTPCGRMYPEEENAGYCPRDNTIYLFPRYMKTQSQEIGDYAPFTIIGHEWGHHVQTMMGIPRIESKPFELQADCFSGAFMAYVEDHRLLDDGDFMEAIVNTLESGDPLGLPSDAGDAHGTSEERVKALMKGYGGGIEKCGVPPLTGIPTPAQVVDRNPPMPPLTPTPNSDFPGPTLAPRLPTALPLAHANCFGIVDDGPMTFDQLVGRFSGFPDASARLQGWGWQASAYRQFGCAGPPEGDAGWIDISVHGFANAASAQAAADYFAAARQDGTSLRRADGPGVGDYSIALVGPATNGKEFTIYATRGPWLVRVTGVSPSGIPFMNVRTVAIDVLDAQGMSGVPSVPPASASTSSIPSQSSETYLPNSPNLNNAACFRTHSRGSISYGDVREAFARTNAGAGAAETYGWQDGAWVVFICDDPPFGRARQLDVSIHQFRDASAAQQASSAVKAFQMPGDHESRACDTVGSLVICVSGYADTGSPLSDVYFVLNQVVASAK